MKTALRILTILSLAFLFNCSSNKKKKNDSVVVSTPEAGSSSTSSGAINGTMDPSATGAPPLYSDSTINSSGSDVIGPGAINAGTIDTSDIIGGDSSAISYGSGELTVNGSSDDMAAGGLSTVYFPFNSASLITTARSLLDSNVQYLKDNPSVGVQLEGHCDDRGSVQYNLALGENRANTVKDYLVSQGISSFRISTISYGKERPLDYTQDESGWAKNRRVNFVVTSK